MRLQNGCGWGVAIVLCALLSQSAQAENGRPSRQMLEQMGWGSLVVMSDDEAMAVRGEGFRGGGSYVRVTGSSWATIGNPNAGAHSEDSYFADGKHVAKGSNSSFAGVAHIWIDGHRGGRKDKGGDWGGMDNNGPWHNMKPRGGDSGWNQPGGDMHGGKPRGGFNGHVKIHATIFFAGGHSSAWAF